MPRIYQPTALVAGQTLNLTAEGARHVQVLRMQPGQGITLFGDPAVGGEWSATITDMGRSHVTVQVGLHIALEREWPVAVHLVVSMPANDRMDWLVEKATELGVASIQPLMSERSVLRLKDERATKKQAHWQAVAVSACEQCGGNRVPVVHAVQTLEAWLRASRLPEGCRLAVLSLAAGSQPLPQVWAGWAASWGQGSDQPPHEPDRPQLALVLGPEGGVEPGRRTGLAERGGYTHELGAPCVAQ